MDKEALNAPCAFLKIELLDNVDYNEFL